MADFADDQATSFSTIGRMRRIEQHLDREITVDAYQRYFPHQNRSWIYRKWFLLRYDVAMTISRIRTWWYCKRRRS